jgi:hypothetical protein
MDRPGQVEAAETMITMYCQSCGKKLEFEPTVGGAWMCSCGSSLLSSVPKPVFVLGNGNLIATLPFSSGPHLHLMTPDPED